MSEVFVVVDVEDEKENVVVENVAHLSFIDAYKKACKMNHENKGHLGRYKVVELTLK